MDTIPLSRDDRAILELEGPHIVGHTCKITILEPPVPSVLALRAHVASRIEHAPLLRRRLAGSAVDPVWVQDRTVDLDAHVVACGQASGDADLRRHVAALFAQHLDRDRPLWRLDVIALPDDALALVWRIHHALADGVTTMRLGEAILWTPAAPAPGPITSPRLEPGHAGHADDEHRRRGHLAGFLRREFAAAPNRSPFDAEVGSQRSVAFASVPLAPLRDSARRLAGATVNEAVLSVIAGALRRWLVHHHASPAAIRLRVPVSLHHEGDDPGNRDSFFTLPVSLHEEDPVARLRQVRAESAERKQEHDAERLESFLDSLGSLSPRLRRLAERIASGPRSFALAISNVPGPREPVDVCGARARSLHCLAEVGRRHGLRVAVVSLAGTLGVGITADPAIAPDLDELAAGIEAESAALSAATG